MNLPDSNSVKSLVFEYITFFRVLLNFQIIYFLRIYFMNTLTAMVPTVLGTGVVSERSNPT